MQHKQYWSLARSSAVQTRSTNLASIVQNMKGEVNKVCHGYLISGLKPLYGSTQIVIAACG